MRNGPSEEEPDEEEDEEEDDGMSGGPSPRGDALTSLRKKMQAPDPTDPNPSTNPINTDTRQPFPNDSVKESSTGTTTTFDTTKDILSTANVNQKEIWPGLARRLAKAATLTAVLMNPVREVMTAVDHRYDLVEVACAPTSMMTQVFEENIFECLRVNHLTGFNLDTKKGTQQLHERMSERPARMHLDGRHTC